MDCLSVVKVWRQILRTGEVPGFLLKATFGKRLRDV